MSKVGRGAMPMGARFDPDASVAENAASAWERAQELIRQGQERQLKLGLRNAFRLEEMPDVFYLGQYPRVPLVEIGEDLVAYADGSLQLADRCGICAEILRFSEFHSLATYGERLAIRDADEPFVCRSCEYKEALAGVGKKR